METIIIVIKKKSTKISNRSNVILYNNTTEGPYHHRFNVNKNIHLLTFLLCLRPPEPHPRLIVLALADEGA